MKNLPIELTPIEKALTILAEHIELCPYNNYKVREEVWELIGVVKVEKLKNTK